MIIFTEQVLRPAVEMPGLAKMAVEEVAQARINLYWHKPTFTGRGSNIMDRISRNEFVNRLQNDWGVLISRYKALPVEEQQAYLTRQGYASLNGLLGHILAWWMDGQQMVGEMQKNPGLPLADYDVDTFNASAAARYSEVDETSVINLFETQRKVMLDLVMKLTESELHQENINTRLYYEIIYHWTEHE